MSTSISHITFTRTHPEVSATNIGRIRIRLSADTSVVIDQDNARMLMEDIESALIGLAVRNDKYESPLAE